MKRSIVAGGVLALGLIMYAAGAVASDAGAVASDGVRGGGVFDVEAWRAVLSFAGLAAFVTLAGLEIILGIDNIVFITVLTGKLPEAERPRARRLGLLVAMFSRILLLLFVGWLIQLTRNLFQIPVINADDGVSGKDLILLGGGAFLLFKAVREIHAKVEGKLEEEGSGGPNAASNFAAVLVQIMLVDIVFSLDSVITAVGMTANIPVMILAVVASVIVMMASADSIAAFVEAHPAVKVLALSFLVLIGVLLIAEGFGQHLDKGYIYFAMAFALVVELLQIRRRRNVDRIDAVAGG